MDNEQKQPADAVGSSEGLGGAAPEREHAACPRCGGQPETVRVGATYWRAQCPKQHMPWRVLGHTMKTKRAALEEWDRIYADSKTPNVAIEPRR